MNKIVLKDVNDKHAIYFYYPEGRQSCGIIKVNVDGNVDDESECIVLYSDEDSKLGYYAYKAVYEICERLKKNDMSESFIQAWY